MSGAASRGASAGSRVLYHRHTSRDHTQRTAGREPATDAATAMAPPMQRTGGLKRSRQGTPFLRILIHSLEMTSSSASISKIRGNAARMLWMSADRAGGRPAVRERDRTSSYRELRDRAAAFAAALHECGAAPGDRVAIFLERGADAAAAYFGVWAAGGVAVVINETLRTRQVAHVLGHSGARALITSRAALQRLPRAPSAEVHLILAEEVPSRATWSPEVREADDLAQITFTSGSTGLPKGVAATHGNVWCAIETVSSYLGLRSDDRVASLLPFSSVYGANQLLCSVLVGAELIIERSPLPNLIAVSLREAGATVLAAVPPLWMQLLGAPEFAERPIESLRILQNAGAHLTPAAVRALRTAQPRAGLFLQYGLTEVFRSTFLPPEEVDQRPDSIGRAIPGAEILVLREDLSACAAGEVGELVQAGPTVTRGYWDDPTRTAEVFRPHPIDPAGGSAVFSGDLVRFDEEGFLYFVGRRDRMIKSLGHRVGPDEILDALHGSDEILEGIITTEPDAIRGDLIVAYVVLKPQGSIERLKSFARRELPRHMQPARIEVLEELPRTASGKHDLAKLREDLARRPPPTALTERTP